MSERLIIPTNHFANLRALTLPASDPLQRQEVPLLPEKNQQQETKHVYVDKVCSSMRHKHRVCQDNLKNNNNKSAEDSEEDSREAVEDSASPQEEQNVIEDSSMAILARAMSSPQELSIAASNATRMLSSSPSENPLQQDENVMKEWIPQFPRSYSYFSLFRFASAVDYTFMAIGTIAAMGAGCCIPVIIYFLGNLIRTKALADKMNCTDIDNSSSACGTLLESCNHNFLPLNNSKKTTDHVEFFMELELQITFVYTLLSSVYFFCWNYASQNQGGKLRRAYFESLLQKDMSWFDTQNAPDAINRMMENTRRITEGIGESIPAAISLFIMCCLCLPLAVYHGFQLSLVCLATLPLSLGSIWLVNRWKAARILKERRAYRVAHDLAKEVMSNIRTVIGYNLQMTERALYQREISRGYNYVLKAIFQQSVAVGLMYIVNFGLWALVFWYGMELVLHDILKTCEDETKTLLYDAGDMFIIVMSVLFGFSNVYNVGVVMNAAKVAKLCGEEVLKLLDTPKEKDNLCIDGICLEEGIVGKVEFIDVRFTYPGNKRCLILNHLNVAVEPNTIVAIVGLSGSGKSTVLKLICKEYVADSGLITIDGHDIRSLNTTWLRSQIGYVPQELHLFDMSIEDNVRMGKLDAHFYQIQEACIMAGAHDFIISFKEGYRTKIGHKGSRLTPGQKQLLVIARALIREPKILLLDEPTHVFDSHSDTEFMRSLQTISRDRTVILVAHRLATVIHANMIYVLKNGKVVENGDHRKLIRNKGPYSQLCMMNRPSNSYHPGKSKIKAFDTSEITIISCVKTFGQKPILPNLCSDMLSVDPVVSTVTDAILSTDKDTEQGFHAKLEWTLTNVEEVNMTMTSIQENDILEGLQEIPDAYNSDTNDTDPIAKVSVFNMQSRQEIIADEYHDISILNAGMSNWLRIMILGSTNYWLIVCGTMSTVLFSIGIPFFGYILAVVIDVLSDIRGYPRNWEWAPALATFDHSFPMIITFAILTIGGYSGMFAFFQDFLLNLAAYKSVQKIRCLLYKCILNQDISFFEDPRHSPIALASVLFQDSDSIRHLTIGVYANFLQCFGMLIIPTAICIFHSHELTGYILLIIMLIMGFNLTDGWLAKKQYGRTIISLQHMSKLILQIFQSKHVITVCQIEPYYLNEFTTMQRKSLRVIKGLSCVRIFTYGMSQGAAFWGFGVFLYLGIERISTGANSFLDIMAFLIMFGLLNLGTNLSVIMGFKHITKGGKRMLEIINRKPLLLHNAGLKITNEDCTKEIEFVNAHFWRHHTAADSTLLKGINLAIPPMQVTAIVGYPESGMSSFLELLGRFYDATGGLVTIAGKDIHYCSSDSLHEHISIVYKNPELFSRTVAQNIALGATFQKPSMVEVIQAAKAANAHNLIVSLPNGYETRIGGENDYLSSTQRQKINIARALLKNPKILIFDDVTSQLDKEGEKTVLETIMTIKRNRTVIMISHRIQPVQDADWIVVMEKGYVEEQGTHDQLLRQRTSGIYAHIWKSQNPLEDENFLKGITFKDVDKPDKKYKSSVAFENYPTATRRSGEMLQQSTIQTKLPKKSSSRRSVKMKAKKEEDEPTSMCWGFLSFLGLGIVEKNNEEDHGGNDKGDSYNG